LQVVQRAGVAHFEDFFIASSIDVLLQDPMQRLWPGIALIHKDVTLALLK